MIKKINVFVAGHNGMVGSALCRQLSKDNFVNIIKASKDDLDLENQSDVDYFFSINKIDQVYLAAAKVGGINANNLYPYDFLLKNLLIQNNVISSSLKYHVKKLLFLGSSCIYPKLSKQPIKEEYLLTGPLEETNYAYAIAKIAGIKLCQSINSQFKDKNDFFYHSVMPCNLYGEGDNYDLQNSHVIPALIRKLHEAKIKGDKIVKVWGSGKPLREFMHVDDLAEGCIFLMNIEKDKYTRNFGSNLSHINLGSGEEISIWDLACMIKDIVGFDGKLELDNTMPDGTPRKVMDSSKIHKLGFKSKITLRDGLEITYKNFYKEENRL